MREYSAALVIDIFRKEYPEIESSIRQRLDDDLPQRLQDLNFIPEIISSFKSIKGISGNNWTNKSGTRVISENRELIMAVILLLYQPEKIMRISDLRLKRFILSKVSAELGCSRDVLKMSLAGIIVAFRAYKEFREETYRIYELIKEKHQFFK